MSTIGPERAAKLSAELQSKLPLDQAQHHALVIENDLAGRVVLAVLWTQRSQLTVHLVTDEPTASHIRDLKAALETVRNPPNVQLIDLHSAQQLAATTTPLIWALDPERTTQQMHSQIEKRSRDSTLTPLFTGFEALDGKSPDQTKPLHELLMRDVISHHARFLNFFGDRFNPQNLYERSKYPQWLTLPQDFDAAVPQIWNTLVDPTGHVVDRSEFSGPLQLPGEYLTTGARLEVDFSPLGNIFASTSDLTIDCDSLCDHHGIQLQVHRNDKLVHAVDIASGERQLKLPLAGVRPSEVVSVSVAVVQDHSTSDNCSVNLRLTVHPSGTHAQPNLITRIRAWLAGLPRRRRRGA